MRTFDRGRRWAVVVLAGALLAGPAAVAGPAAPVWADCGAQGPAADMAAHRGFAFDGTIVDLTGRDAGEAGWQDRLTLRVDRALAGSPGETVTFDLGRGACAQLQGDRYKVGDRLIVTASAPPTNGDVTFLADALTWRYEFGDTWSFHGLPDEVAAAMPAAFRVATTRDAIVALVAPDALPYRVVPDAWSVALRRSAPGERLLDVAPWGDGFVALGRRGEGPAFWTSADGRRWERVARPLPADEGRAWNLVRLLPFHGALYAVGSAGEYAVALRSTDGGRTWRFALSQPLGDPRAEPGDTLPPLRILGAAAGADRMILLAKAQGDDTASSGRVWTTTDGETWARAKPTQLGPFLEDLEAAGTGFVGRFCGGSGPVPVCTLQASPDGIDWQRSGVAPAGTVDVAWDPTGGRLLAATGEVRADTEHTATLDASTDATTWSRLVTAPGRTSVPATVATAADGTIVLTGRSADAAAPRWGMVSGDGGATWTWSPLPGGSRPCVARVAIGTGRIVAVGGCGKVLAWSADR